MNPLPLIIVVIFICFDVMTGWLQAINNKTANSSIMRTGLFHKLAEIISVIFGYVCEMTFPYTGLDVKIPFTTGIATYIVIMETASIVENIAKMNPAMANILGKFFDKDKLNPDNSTEVNHENKSAGSR
jgi:toxin secretion/phage lysis holin